MSSLSDDYRRCSRKRFCELDMTSNKCPCDDPDSLSAELRYYAEEISGIDGIRDDLYRIETGEDPWA